MPKANVSLSFAVFYVLTRLCQIRTNESGDGDLVINTTTTLREANNDSSLIDEDFPGIFIINSSGGFNQIGGTSLASGVSNGPGNGNSGGGILGGTNINNNFGAGFNNGDGGVKWSLNCDFPGHDIGRIESSGEECGGICIANLQCTHFSRPDNGFCYMKKATLTTSYTTTNGGMCGFVPWRTEYFDGILKFSQANMFPINIFVEKGGKIGMMARAALNGYAIVISLITILNAKKLPEKNVEAPVKPIQNVPTFATPMTMATVT